MKVEIETPFITLQALLKLADVASTGGFSKVLIKGGYVYVNEEQDLRRGRKVYPGERVLIDSEEYNIKEEIQVVKK